MTMNNDTPPWLDARTFYLTSYGGVAAAPADFCYSFYKDFRNRKTKNGLLVYEVREFFSMLSLRQPEAMGILFAGTRHVVRCSYIGKMLMEAKPLMLADELDYIALDGVCVKIMSATLGD